MSEEELMAAYYGCDAAAFDTLAAGTLSRLRAWFWNRGAPAHEVDDLCQLTLVKVAVTKDDTRFTLSRSFRPWLFSIAHRVAIDAFRGRMRDQSRRGEAPEHATSSDPTPEDRLLDDHARRALYECQQALPDEQRDVLALWSASVTLEDIAATYSRSVAWAWRTKSAALQALRRSLEQRGVDPEDLLK